MIVSKTRLMVTLNGGKGKIIIREVVIWKL